MKFHQSLILISGLDYMDWFHLGIVDKLLEVLMQEMGSTIARNMKN